MRLSSPPFVRLFLSLSLALSLSQNFQNSPGVAEGRGSDQKVGARAGDEAQGVVSRLGVPVLFWVSKRTGEIKISEIDLFFFFFSFPERVEVRKKKIEKVKDLQKTKLEKIRKNSLPEVDVGVVENIAVEVEVVEALIF